MAIRHTKPGGSLLPKRRPVKRAKYEWAPARDMYVEGIQTDPDDTLAIHWPTLAEVAKACNIPESSVMQKCAQQHWVEQKNSFIQTIAIKRRRKRTGELAKVASQFDNNVLNIGKLGMAIVANRLGKIARNATEREKYQQMVEEQMRRGELVDLNNPQLNQGVSDVDSKEMLDLAMAAQRFDDIARRILSPIDPEDMNAGDVSVEDQISIRDRMESADEDRLAVAISTLQSIGLDSLTEVMGGASRLELEASERDRKAAHSDGDGHSDGRGRSRFSIGADNDGGITPAQGQANGAETDGPHMTALAVTAEQLGTVHTSSEPLTEFQKQVIANTVKEKVAEKVEKLRSHDELVQT